MRISKHSFIAALLGLSGLMASTLAGAQGDALLRCPRLADRDARLACYDAILPPATAPAAGATPAVPRTAATATPAAAPVATPAATAATPAAMAAAQKSVPAPADSAQTFGLANRARTGEVQSIDTEVMPGFYGWGPNERIRLVNKQVWRVDDSSSGTIDPSKRKVTVRRGLLGSFFLEFEGLTKSPRVSRVE